MKEKKALARGCPQAKALKVFKLPYCVVNQSWKSERYVICQEGDDDKR